MQKRVGMRTDVLLFGAVLFLMCVLTFIGQPSPRTLHPGFEEGSRKALRSLERQLGHKIRALPSVLKRSPVLAASNWDGPASKQDWDVTRAVLVEKCGGTVVRDFPDVELWLSTADEPSSCSLHVPVLQYSILDMNTTKAARYSDVGYVDGVPFSIPHLLTGERPKGQPRPSSVQFTRGYAIPHGPVWESLSMLPEELQMLQARVMAASQQKQPQLRPQAVWRGTNTGSLRGWPPESSDILSRYGDPWAPLLFTKRAHLVRMSQMHPDILDVGLHEVTSHLLSESIGRDPVLLLAAQSLLTKPYIPMDDWSTYSIQLSIDKHGVPFRLPQQYLQGRSVILKMKSPLIDWCDHRFKKGVHYDTFRYDLTDLVDQVQATLNVSLSRREAMVRSARNRAVEVYNIFSQLDALMYAVLKVKEACPWTIEVPLAGGVSAWSSWSRPHLNRTSNALQWRSPLLRAPWAESIRSSILQTLHNNFPNAAVQIS